MKYVSAIVAAAGTGTRLGSRVPKPLVKINSLPLIIYSLNTLSRVASIKEIIVVFSAAGINAANREIRRQRILKIKCVVAGGKRRQDSVLNGLQQVSAQADLVLIHDAARPFVRQDTIVSTIKEAARSGAAVAAVPVKSTIKEACGKYFIKRTLDRKSLWEIQTPQVFRKDSILKAYARFGAEDVTDDAALVEKLGARVRIVPAAYDNIKITTPEDLEIANAISRRHRL